MYLVAMPLVAWALASLAAARSALGDRRISIVECHDPDKAYHRRAKQRCYR